MGDDEEESIKKKGNALPIWGNAQSMNINNLVVTNILSSPYFKNELFKLKTFHEVIDEIYYKVDHLEPWERGSRKTHGQVGMCGGVRGVGAGGIVSSGYCLLYKLFTLKLTEKQVNALINHADSPYIRGLGFMFIRYCQHPNTFWYWFEHYLEDDEEIDPKAGAGSPMTIGQMIRSFILKLDWYGTLLPRIPVPIHKELEERLRERNLNDDRKVYANDDDGEEKKEKYDEDDDGKDTSRDNENGNFGEAEKYSRRKNDESRHGSSAERDRDRRDGDRSKDRDRSGNSSRSASYRRSRSRERHDSREGKHSRDHDRKRDRDQDRNRDKRDGPRKRSIERSRERRRSGSRERRR